MTTDKDRRRGPPAVDIEEIPSFWFCLMEACKTRGDFEQAAHAKRELERLGVFVRYRSPRSHTTAGGLANATG